MILGGKLPGKVGRRRFFIRPHGQAVKTSPFHGGNSGSIPDGVTIQARFYRAFSFYILLLNHYYSIFFVLFADMVELADTQDLGSCGRPCRFESCYPHHKMK